jgi:hypothetical protein
MMAVQKGLKRAGDIIMTVETGIIYNMEPKTNLVKKSWETVGNCIKKAMQN